MCGVHMQWSRKMGGGAKVMDILVKKRKYLYMYSHVCTCEYAGMCVLVLLLMI